jgi:drug/metabolite transporter (DMT)-like permease
LLVGVLLAVLTSASWACGNVLIQRTGRRLGSFRALAWAIVTGAVLAGVASVVLDPSPRSFSGSVAAWSVAAGASALLAYVGLFYAFEHAKLSIAVPFVSSWSLVTAVVSIAFLGERPRPAQLAGAALVFLGVVTVSVGASRDRGAGDAAKGRRQTLALAAATASALGFGVMVPSIAQIARSVGEFGASSVAYVACLAVGLPLALAFRLDLRPPPVAVWPLVLLTGVAETAGFVAVAFARRYAPMAVVAPLASLAATFTVAFAWLVLRERPHPLALLGAAFACTGVVVLAL